MESQGLRGESESVEYKLLLLYLFEIKHIVLGTNIYIGDKDGI